LEADQLLPVKQQNNRKQCFSPLKDILNFLVVIEVLDLIVYMTMDKQKLRFMPKLQKERT